MKPKPFEFRKLMIFIASLFVGLIVCFIPSQTISSSDHANTSCTGYFCSPRFVITEDRESTTRGHGFPLVAFSTYHKSVANGVASENTDAKLNQVALLVDVFLVAVVAVAVTLVLSFMLRKRVS